MSSYDVFIDFADLVGDTITFTMTADAANTTTFMAVINLLIQDEQARVISRPYLATTSGSPAKLEVAEDRFVVVAQPSGDDITLQEVSSGVTMNITPVLCNNLIQLDMEISESRFIPSLENVEQRRSRNAITTAAQVEDGQTVIIGGLMLATRGQSVAGIPGLRDVPGLNLVFGHQDKVDQRTQVMVFVTPHRWTPGMRTPIQPMDGMTIYDENQLRDSARPLLRESASLAPAR
ncbi:MAG: type II and III secretion system protein [Candidatus Competibacteraceae bacterium]